MRSALLVIGVLVISVASAQTPSNKQEQVPTAILLNSRYVYVEAWDGDFFNPHLLPEDRKAILDVQNALKDWNRYLVAVKRHEAEILVVVRKGRIVTVNGGIGRNLGSGSGQSSPRDELGSNQPKTEGGDKAGVGPEVAGRDDLFFVYLVNPNGSLTGPIWIHHQKDGLDTPGIPLFQQFKESIDAASKVATSKAHTPNSH
jgi:hypothetical protein